ncbi:MAG: ATP-binding protein [Alphaproteobacteria bacterium]
MFKVKSKTSNSNVGGFGSSIYDKLEVGHAKSPLAFKIPIAAFLLTIITAIIIGTTFYLESNEIVIQKRLKDVEANSKLLSVMINNFYEDLNSDVMFLNGTPPVQEIIKATEGNNKKELIAWKTRLNTIFSTMLYSNNSYVKIRFIGMDDGGKEIVKVVSNGHQITKTPDGGLHKLGDTGFFKTAITYAKGAVYFSEPELNREFGKLTKPHKAILKAAIPVFNEGTGKIFGVIVICADYDKMVSKLINAVAKYTSLYVANDNGDYLVHPNKNKSFRFDLNETSKIQDEFPFLSKVVSNDITSLEVLDFYDKKYEQDIGNYNVISFDNVDVENSVRVLLISSDEEYLKSIAGVRYRSLVLELALSIVALVFAIFASRKFTAPLKQMTTSVQQFEKTGRVEDLPIKSNDEIGVLARAFYNTLEISKEREVDAKSANARMMAILESAADAIITIDINGKILSCNAAAERTFGYSDGEVVGESVETLIPALHNEESNNYFANYLNSTSMEGSGSHRDVQAIRKCGEEFPIELSVSEVKTDTEHLYTGVIRDVSQRRSVEETLVTYAQELEGKSLELELLRQKADAANNARGDFLANMSHEIRTPMNGIIGTCSLMGETKLTKKQSTYLDTITNSSEALLHIINDILDFSKIEAGKLDFEHIPFNLSLLINEIKDVMSVNTTDEVNMSLSYPDNFPCYVYGDPVRIRQILFNLISNAIKFTSHGFVEIKVENVVPKDSKHEFTISVKDSGIGISDDKIGHIFEKFGQAEEDTTRKFGGTGLGLSICSELVRMMDGQVTVDSVFGEGSKFTFTICLEPSTKQEVDNQEGLENIGTEELDPDNVSFDGFKVLLADDNFTNMIIVTEMLEQCGCNVTPAVNGVEAVDIESKNKFDLIFMDCRMPEMDGYEATRNIRERESSEGVDRSTIIALTANAMKGDREKCLDAGMDDYITKPIKKELLIKTLLSHLAVKK